MDSDLREIVDLSLRPIKEGIDKIEINISKMTEDIQDIKLQAGIQQKDIDLIKAQLQAQEMSVNALRDCLSSTENKLSARITEIENKDANKKAKFFDSITNGVIGKIGTIVVVLLIIGLCVVLGIDFHNVINSIK